MYQLLQESPLQFGGGLTFPEYRRVRDGLQLSVTRIKEYRRKNPRYQIGCADLQRQDRRQRALVHTELQTDFRTLERTSVATWTLSGSKVDGSHYCKH
jgi:hypothetical protein